MKTIFNSREFVYKKLRCLRNLDKYLSSQTKQSKTKTEESFVTCL